MHNANIDIVHQLDYDLEISADIMTGLLTDTSWPTYKMFEHILWAYIDGNDDVKRGIDMALEDITGWNLNSIAGQVLDAVKEDMLDDDD